MPATQTAAAAKARAAKPPAAKQAAPKTTPAAKKLPAKTPPKAAPKKATLKAVPKKAETITLKSVFDQLAMAHAMTAKQGQSLLGGFVESVTGILKSGDRVRMSGIGTLEVKDRPARMGRNPKTGAAVAIAASRKIAFRASKELKEAV